MARMTKEMMDMIANNQCFIATATKEGIPNIGPKMSTRALNEETIIFFEGTGGKTYKNLQENPYAAIAVVNREQMKGFRFCGPIELISAGELYDEASNQSQQMGFPPPLAVAVMHVEEIYDLSPGPNAGKKIA